MFEKVLIKRSRQPEECEPTIPKVKRWYSNLVAIGILSQERKSSRNEIVMFQIKSYELNVEIRK